MRDFCSHRILVLDDNAADAELIRMILGDIRPFLEIHWIKDGEEAIRYLMALGPEKKKPDLVFLDWKIPITDGATILGTIRSIDFLKAIPVLVLSTFLSPTERKECYQLGANCVVEKPMDLDTFRASLRMVAQFWLDVVQLPR